ncbi:MAG: hypothetical protein P8Q36_13585 [Alphaproteobacteria bacterium]|jgi:hypothetical protein|nr:hypothetical protein [Rhodospirillaceae bacterium]MBT6511174.1 hypothetical protein [Rhodospirillaceae bacterium]MBT7614410.1 hypothetical protein [Rhodospirillaceae bacterium]MBT7646747.1 hypothetical protein [Rhodospirillaceae bacterium]MDG2481878.1 hypothetical protein [Alphaproteobacteria bacterium]
MRIFLMLLGAVISGGALLVWLYLNAMAAAWNTSSTKSSIHWFTLEFFFWFWLPFAIGAVVIFIGWRWGQSVSPPPEV